MSTHQIIANRFEISDLERDLLGRGGMGDVYQGIDTQTGQPVAIKALKPDVVARSPDIVARFIREGEALRQLNHPNIVKMVAAVEEEGRYFLVMEYVGGGSLEDLLEEQGRLSIERVVEISLEVADALTRTHHLGIIHRDLKPANVLLAEDGTPRLTDFGIALIARADSPRLTHTGMLVGTIDYLSPEACRGEPLDARADIWAFGVMVYEMLTGERPFLGDTVTAKLIAILTQPVPDLRALSLDVPDALADLVYRMLEKDGHQRIPSVRLVGAGLEAILHEREITPLLSHPAPAAPPVAGRFATPTPPANVQKHNLPVQTTPFVGREAELAELARLLADPSVRLLTVLGAGGMGKTRLALEAGAAEIDHFEDGVFFVSLAPLQSVEAIVATVAEAVGFSFYEGGEPKQQLLDYLCQKKVLILMDNYEHLLDGVGLVSEVLQRAPDVKVLATSRARLNVGGEHRFQIAGMDFPDWEAPEDALEYSAVKLFVQSARRARPGFELEADDLRYVARICQLVGGMPLGILLAAAWVEMLSPEEIATEIGQSLDFLETDLRDVPERQRSMRALFDYSWNLLTGRERDVLQGLSVFRGGFTRESAQEVTGASLRELMALVNRSLLRRDPAGRYTIHELLRQYGEERLEEAPVEKETVQDRHCAYYAEFLQQREARLTGRGRKQALAEIRPEADNIRTGWNRAVAQGRFEEIEQCLETLAGFCRIQGWYREGETLFSQAVQRLTGIQGDRTRLLRGKLLLQQGRFANLLGKAAEADRLQEASLVIFRDLGAERDTAHAVCLLGGCENLYGSPRRELCLEGVRLFQKLGDRRGIALALYGLAWSTWYSGEYVDAKQNFQESLALFRQVGDLEGIHASLHGLGYICWILGEYKRGRELHLEMLRLCREAGSQGGIARALGDLGIDAYALQQYDEAHDLFGQSLAIYRHIGNASGICDELGDLAELANAMGDYAQAERCVREALSMFPEDEPSLTDAAWEYRNLGNAACGLGNYADARKYLCRSLELAATAQLLSRHPLTLVGVARVLAKQGDKERALELLALVMNHRLSWQMAKDQAAPLIAELEAELSPDVVTAAQERGRSRDLEATVAELMVEWGE